MSYHLVLYLIICHLIHLILRDTTLKMGANGTDLFNLYARLQYPSYCFNNAMCKSSFRQQCLDKIKDPRIHNMEVPLSDGQTLRFKGRVRSVTEYCDGSERKY